MSRATVGVNPELGVATHREKILSLQQRAITVATVVVVVGVANRNSWGKKILGTA